MDDGVLLNRLEELAGKLGIEIRYTIVVRSALQLIAGAHLVAACKRFLATGLGKARHFEPFLLPACGVDVLYFRDCIEGLADLDAVIYRGTENECTEVEIHIRIIKMIANVGIVGIEDFLLLLAVVSLIARHFIL